MVSVPLLPTELKVAHLLHVQPKQIAVEERLLEDDVLFKPDDRETYDHIAERVKTVLNRGNKNKDDLGRLDEHANLSDRTCSV